MRPVTALLLTVCAALPAVAGAQTQPDAAMLSTMRLRFIGDVGLRISWSAQECRAVSEDADSDGLDDRCELDLVAAFAPELVVDSRDCLWQPSDSGARRLGGAYLFAAQPLGDGIRVAYLPAYYRDCGWTGAACVIRLGWCGSHPGDSELILMDVVPVGEDGWRTTGVFLSAHCLGRSGGRCRWYRNDDLRAFDWIAGNRFGAPRVWVARGKHGNYPTKHACDTGHWLLDSCDRNDSNVRFPVVSAHQNIGSRSRPLPNRDGCLSGSELAIGGGEAAPQARECVWDLSRPFGGWQIDTRRNAGTPYARHLTRFAGF